MFVAQYGADIVLWYVVVELESRQARSSARLSRRNHRFTSENFAVSCVYSFSSDSNP